MKKGFQQRFVWQKLLTDEQGFSLIEILGALIILGIALLIIAALVLQNKRAIALNRQREEAIAVREDIKEWLSYKAQIQDIANLNQWVFTPDDSSETEAMQERKKHLILDNSGVQTENGQPKYGERTIDETDKRRGRLIRKVHYEPNDGSFLPHSLAKDENNRLYMGQYVTDTGSKTDYLVKVLVEQKKVVSKLNAGDHQSALSNQTQMNASYDPRKDGVLLTIQIYDQKTGRLLTETYLNWIVEG